MRVDMLSDPGWSPPDRSPPPPPLPVIAASDFAGCRVPTRPWHVPDLVPGRTVTLLGGDGGTGKSLLALQLAVATATGTDWCAGLPEPGPAIYVSAEDDIDELHRRLADICDARGLDLADLGDLRIVPLAGRDAVLGAAKGAIIGATPVFDQVRAEVAQHRPALVVLDTLADLFAGNENDRAQARQFVGLLRGLAIDFGCAVVCLAHPSLSGLASGSGSSGSTGWSNSVRSRLYLERVKVDDGAEPDPDLRRLSIKKANYAAAGGDILLRWRDGIFVRDASGPTGLDRLAAERRADDVFLELLRRFTAEGRSVSPSPSTTWAPKSFAAHPDARGVSKRGFAAAMDRLLGDGRVVIVTEGPPSKARQRLAEASR